MRVIYIVGYGRSGSTLLDMMLGNNRDVFASGELCNLMNAYLEGEYCACHETVAQCPLWSTIIDNWMQANTLSRDDARQFAALDYHYSHSRRPGAWLAALSPRPGPRYRRYLLLLASLFREISRFSGAAVITDSSKSPVRLIHLENAMRGEVEAIHLVKSPAAVIASLGKAYSADKAGGVQRALPARSKYRTGLFWLVINRMAEFAITRSGVKHVLVRYQNLVAQPESTLRTIDARFRFTEPLHNQHICAGNRMRMEKSVRVKRKTESPRLRGRLLSMLLTPSIRRYGFAANGSSERP